MWLSKLAGLKTLIWKLGYLIVILFRKKIVFAAAVYTTFSNSISSFLQFLSGGQSFNEFGSVFVSEAGNKFLGAAPNFLDALKSLNGGEWLNGLVLLWTAFASIYMMLFLYKLFRAKGMTSEVEWPEQALVLLVWFLASGLVHGTGLLYGVLDQLKLFLDSLSSLLPSFSGGEGSLNSSVLNESVGNSSTGFQ